MQSRFFSCCVRPEVDSQFLDVELMETTTPLLPQSSSSETIPPGWIACGATDNVYCYIHPYYAGGFVICCLCIAGCITGYAFLTSACGTQFFETPPTALIPKAEWCENFGSFTIRNSRNNPCLNEAFTVGGCFLGCCAGPLAAGEIAERRDCHPIRKSFRQMF
jgi:hypothetical protein